MFGVMELRQQKTIMDIKRELHKRLIKEEKETPKTWKEAVNMEKLTEFAKGLRLICMGEYGITYINEKEMKIAVCLGDANPFGKLEELEDWIRWECIDGPHDFISSFDIEIDTEWGPTGENWRELK